MSQDDQAAPSPNRDSRLEAFLRQASAIIAAEKGLNNAAKAKLDELAMRLHLPDELFETGLQQLQDSNSPIGELTSYEQGFIDFLIKEFGRMPKGTVLSISIEEKAIAHAKEKFEIPAHRAEKLIGYQTAESGFGRLSRSDAKDFGRQSILDHVGEKVSLDKRTEARVFRIGRRWGCPQEEVEQLLNERFAENRRIAKVEQQRPVMLGIATVVCVSLIGVASWWLVSNREMIFGKPVVIKDPVPIVKVVEETVEPATEMESLFAEFGESLKSENVTTRGDAIAKVTNRVLNSRQDMSRQFRAIAAWYFDEKDPAVASRVVQAIDKALSDEPKSNRNGALGLPYRAVAMAISMSRLVPIEEVSPRAKAITQVLKNRTGVEWADSAGPGLSSYDSAIANRQWNQLIQSSWTSPGRCSILVEPLAALTQSKLPVATQQQFVSRSVRTIIIADRLQWRNMKTAIQQTITSADEIQRMEWIDVWLDQYDGTVGFREFTASLLMKGDENAPGPFLHSKRKQWRNRQLRPALVRHQKIAEKIERLKSYISGNVDSKVDPDLVFQAASAANLCLEALSITASGRGSDESAWKDVDVQLERFDQRLRDFVFLEEPLKSSVPKVSSAGFDTTARDRALNSFSDLSDANQASRLAAIERLPRIAARFESIPKPMAAAFARYLLSPIDSDEWLQMQRVLPDVAKWPQLVLAISDQLPNSSVSIDQAMTMNTVLTGSLPEGTSGDQWRDELSLRLLKFVHDSMTLDEVVDPNSSDSDWGRLEKYFASTYYRRNILLGGDGFVGDRSALNLAKQCVKTVSNDVAAAERAIGLIESATENEMEQIVMFNRLLGENAESNHSATVGARLFKSELDLLMKWNLEREKQLQELME